jgi:hypothetical protein
VFLGILQLLSITDVNRHRLLKSMPTPDDPDLMQSRIIDTEPSNGIAKEESKKQIEKEEKDKANIFCAIFWTGGQ